MPQQHNLATFILEKHLTQNSSYTEMSLGARLQREAKFTITIESRRVQCAVKTYSYTRLIVCQSAAD